MNCAVHCRLVTGPHRTQNLWFVLVFDMAALQGHPGTVVCRPDHRAGGAATVLRLQARVQGSVEGPRSRCRWNYVVTLKPLWRRLPCAWV